MRAIKRINNNVAVCEDAGGNELLAMGRGIGFGQLPRDLSLDDVERTFYDVDERYFAAINELPAPVMDFSVLAADYIREELPYQLSPNLVFILADHLSFAIQRAEKNLRVRMPLAYDVELNYPDEYRIARHLVRRARKFLEVALPDDEATAIAINILNARLDAASEAEDERRRRDDEMLEDITEIIEDEFNLTVDRGSFAFSRYATHMHYLFDRLHTGGVLDTSCVEGFRGIERQYPKEFECVERIARYIADAWGDAALSDDERLYLVIHVSRVCIKGGSR